MDKYPAVRVAYIKVCDMLGGGLWTGPSWEREKGREGGGREGGHLLRRPTARLLPACHTATPETHKQVPEHAHPGGSTTTRGKPKEARCIPSTDAAPASPPLRLSCVPPLPTPPTPPQTRVPSPPSRRPCPRAQPSSSTGPWQSSSQHPTPRCVCVCGANIIAQRHTLLTAGGTHACVSQQNNSQRSFNLYTGSQECFLPCKAHPEGFSAPYPRP